MHSLAVWRGGRTRKRGETGVDASQDSPRNDVDVAMTTQERDGHCV